MRSSSRTLLVVTTVLLSVWLGCGKKESDANTTSKAEKSKKDKEAARKAPQTARNAARKAPRKTGKPAKPPVPLHTEIVAAIQKAKSCDLSKRSFTYKCANYKAATAVTNKLHKKQAKEMIRTLSVLVLHEDPKVSKVAAYLLGRRRMIAGLAYMKDQKKKFSPKTAERLMKALSKKVKEGKKWEAFELAVLTTHIANLTGKTSEIIKTAKTLSDELIQTKVIEKLMVHGRMKMFPTIEEMAKSQKPKIRLAAVKAVNNMYKWTPDEIKKLCPFALKYLSEKDLHVAGEAAKVLCQCKGKYVEDLLKEGKKRVKAGEWKKPFVWAYRDICFKGFFGRSKIPPEKICNKVYKFLEWVAKQKNVEPFYRGWALGMIYYQRRNKKTYRLLRKYRNHKVKEIRESARKNMKSLKTHYLKKKK